VHGPLALFGQMTLASLANAPSAVALYEKVNGVPSCSVKVHVPDVVDTAALRSVALNTLLAVEKLVP